MTKTLAGYDVVS